ncbi:MAG TPA: type IV secretion system DNA-binding domain-containing protein [Candidatus Acidoferrales bacterium]|nr:type IV secretion system DNA-binding domain-containing protein [Candidatus Acidoferrales bacterium]
MDEKDSTKQQVTPVAVTNWRDIRKKFGIKQKNRRGHMYIIGKTGTGKSSLIANMAASDIAQGNGLAILDPHGDLAESLLHHVPKERIRDVIYFNPGELEYPIAFNPLEDISKDFHHLVVSGLISVFKKIWSEFWGPRLEHILRYSLFTLLEYPGATLLDITRLLTEVGFRNKVLGYVKRPEIRAFWTYEFDKYSQWLRSEAVAPILNKVGQFLTSLPLRNVVGQSKNTFGLKDVMDTGKILIVNLAKGKVGEDCSSLLGSMIVTEIFLSALSRVNTSEDKRRSFYLYVDEFHNFVTTSFADILSECRKYGLNLVLAHQYINQLHEKIRDAVFGNVASMIMFRVGAEDAKYLARELRPTFEESDLLNLPNYHIYLKLMVDGVTSQPFSATTLPFENSTTSHEAEIVNESKQRYGKPRQLVEHEILSRYRIDDEEKPKGTSGSAQHRLF